jgi:hypothetical protein
MHGCHKYAHLGCLFVGLWEAKIQRSVMEGEAVGCHNFSGCDQYRAFLTTLSSWGSPRGLKGWLYADDSLRGADFHLVAGPSSCRYAPSITNRQILSRRHSAEQAGYRYWRWGGLPGAPVPPGRGPGRDWGSAGAPPPGLGRQASLEVASLLARHRGPPFSVGCPKPKHPRPTAPCHVHGGLKCRSSALWGPLLGAQLVPTL